MKYLRHFIIGSSFPVFISFFIAVNNLIKNKSLKLLDIKNKLNVPLKFNYFRYTITMPFWFGILNVFSNILGDQFNLDLRTQYVLTAIFGWLVLISVLEISEVYNYNQKQWNIHYINTLIYYLFIWNVVVYLIEKLLSNQKVTNQDMQWFIILTILALSIKFRKNI